MSSLYTEKNDVKKFSARNNMDPGNVSEELRVVSVMDNICIVVMWWIFLKMCWNLLRDCLIDTWYSCCTAHRRSSDDRAYKDFNIRRSGVSRALYWLKNNNRYYSNIDCCWWWSFKAVAWKWPVGWSDSAELKFFSMLVIVRIIMSSGLISMKVTGK